MTVNIPTGDLVGILSDVAVFAEPDKEFPKTNAVRIEWDGTCVHAIATDTTRMGISSWHPDDISEEATQEGLFTLRGGDDKPWSIVVRLSDALLVVKNFKLPDKSRWVPLGLDYIPGVGSPHRLRISRHTDSGTVGLSMVLLDQDVDFPDVRAELDAMPEPQEMSKVVFNPEVLAAFGAVRQRGGAMEVTFTGAGSPALVSIGHRFRGAVATIRPARRLATVAA